MPLSNNRMPQHPSLSPPIPTCSPLTQPSSVAASFSATNPLTTSLDVCVEEQKKHDVSRSGRREQTLARIGCVCGEQYCGTAESEGRVGEGLEQSVLGGTLRTATSGPCCSLERSEGVIAGSLSLKPRGGAMRRR